MRQITIKTEIHLFDTLKEFISEFGIGPRDLVFTRKGLLPFFEGIKEMPKFLFNDDYGKGEPTDYIIDSIFADVKAMDFDRVVAIGGGSIVDIAKLLVLKDVSSTRLLFEKKIPAVREKGLIIVPTTCGTGSEVTNVSISAIESLNTKLGLADDGLFADCAVLIPELLEGLPYSVIINSSVDALVHASESFLSPKATAMSEIFSREAINNIITVYKEIAAKGNEEAKKHVKELLLASTYGGLAFGHAGTGVVHAMAYPLGSVYHVAHGEANYQFFMTCFKKYMEKKPDGKIREIMKIFGELLGCKEEEAFNKFEALLNKLLPLKNLREYGMVDSDCAEFADSVVKNQQRLLANNYVPISQDEIKEIFEDRM